MFALLFSEPGHRAAQAVLPCSPKRKKTGKRMSKQKKIAECVL